MSLTMIPHEQGHITVAVREQFERIYEETSYVIAGTLGRTAMIGGEPSYWYRRPDELRDIDVYDPYKQTDNNTYESLQWQPLPLDRTGVRALVADGHSVRLQFPKDTSLAVEVPESYLDTVQGTLLGVPVRTFRPDVMLGLNMAVPYNRLRQRSVISAFDAWVRAQDGFDESVLEPFAELSRMIAAQHPEHVRMLRAKDWARLLPSPAYKALRGVYYKRRK